MLSGETCSIGVADVNHSSCTFSFTSSRAVSLCPAITTSDRPHRNAPLQCSVVEPHGRVRAPQLATLFCVYSLRLAKKQCTT